MVEMRSLERRLSHQLPAFSDEQTAEFASAVRRLVDRFEPDRIYVFGSQARGTAHPDSDIDLLIIVPSAEEPTYRLAAAAYAVLSPLRLPFEMVFMTRQDFESRVPAPTSLPSSVTREGQPLYAA